MPRLRDNVFRPQNYWFLHFLSLYSYIVLWLLTTNTLKFVIFFGSLKLALLCYHVVAVAKQKNCRVPNSVKKKMHPRSHLCVQEARPVDRRWPVSSHRLQIKLGCGEGQLGLFFLISHEKIKHLCNILYYFMPKSSKLLYFGRSCSNYNKFNQTKVFLS